MVLAAHAPQGYGKAARAARIAGLIAGCVARLIAGLEAGTVSGLTGFSRSVMGEPTHRTHPAPWLPSTPLPCSVPLSLKVWQTASEAWQGMPWPSWRRVADYSTRWFGYLVAYVVPGLLTLWGMSHQSPDLARWLRGVGETGPGVGGVLYAMVACVGLGMTASLLRWLVLDHPLAWAGLKRPRVDEALLAGRLEAFDYQVDHHYRYYQFYGNTLVAGCFAYAFARSAYAPHWLVDLGLLVLAAAFVAGARDALTHYFAGIEQVLGLARKELCMTNGKHPHGSVSSKPDSAAPTKAGAAAKPSQRVGADAGAAPKVASNTSKPEKV
jgi:hypothetical protein